MSGSRWSRALTLTASLVLAACATQPAGTDGDDTQTGTTAPDTGPTTGAPGDCGDDVIAAGEECDGADLGGKQCSDVDPAYVGGTLACGASCTYDASGCTIAPDAALVVLNELTSDSVVAGAYAGMGDAIELYNAGGKAADLSGWQLSDDATFPAARTYVFPAGSTLGPGEFRVLVSQDATTMAGDYPFGISDNKVETITLADAGGVTIDSVVVDGYKAVVSYCRLPDGNGAWEQCEQTFGAANQLAATACGNGEIEAPEQCDGEQLGGQDCAGLGLGYTDGALACSPKCRFDATQCTTDSLLVINELESTVDDIEIYNGGDVAVDLSGYILTDDEVGPDYDPVLDDAELIFAPGTTLAAGAYLVVQVGVSPGQHPFGLGMAGDSVYLLRPDRTVVDQVTYGANEALISYCRQPDGPGGAWTADCVPTMGGAN